MTYFVHARLLVLIYVTKMADKVCTQTITSNNQTILSTQLEQGSQTTVGTRDVSSIANRTSYKLASETDYLISSTGSTAVYVSSVFEFNTSKIVASKLDSSFSAITTVISPASSASSSVQDLSVGTGTSPLSVITTDPSETVSTLSSFSTRPLPSITTEVSLSGSSQPGLLVTTETISSASSQQEVSLTIETSSPVSSQQALAITSETSSPVSSQPPLPITTEVSSPVSSRPPLPITTEASSSISSQPPLLITTETSSPVLSLPILPITTETPSSVSQTALPIPTNSSSSSVQHFSTEIKKSSISSLSSPQPAFFITTETSLADSSRPALPTASETSSSSIQYFSTEIVTSSITSVFTFIPKQSEDVSYMRSSLSGSSKATEPSSVENIDSITKVQTSSPILTSTFIVYSSEIEQLPTTDLLITSTLSTPGIDKNFTNILDSYLSTSELPSSTMGSRSNGNSVFNTLTSDIPDRSTDILFSTSTDNELFTELSVTTLYSLSPSKTQSVIPSPSSTISIMDMSSSGLGSASSNFVTPSSTVLNTGATTLHFEPSSVEGYITSLADLPSKQTTFSTDTVLSSFSSIYNLPVISTHTPRSTQQDTLLYSSETPFRSLSTEISETTSLDGIHSATSRLQTVRQTTPDFSGVTSAFDKMSSSSTESQVNQQIKALQREITDHEDTINAYMIAVIVLVLIIVLLLSLIVLYIIRRRRYYEKKQLRIRGIDEDLMGEEETKMRGHKPYFKADQSENLRISGRISTASLGSGENEPLHLLESFNKSKNKPLESTEENNDGKLTVDKIKDEEF